MLMEKVIALANERGIAISRLEKELGIAHGSIRRWNVSQPSGETLGKVADYFGVSVDFLLGRTEHGYYADQDAVILAQQLKDRPEMKILFDATRDVSAEDLQFVVDMINRMKRR